MSIGKGHLSAIGGIDRKEIEMKRKVNNPKIKVKDIPAPPPLEEEDIDNKEEIEEPNEMEQDNVSFDTTKDEFDYYYQLKNRKLKSETHTQITLRLPKTLNTAINKLGKGMNKGWKQEFITRALEKEVRKLQALLNKKKK